MFQMPLQTKAFLLFWKAISSASSPTFLGLYPCLITSTIHVSASTPASEFQIAAVLPEQRHEDPSRSGRDRRNPKALYTFALQLLERSHKLIFVLGRLVRV